MKEFVCGELGAVLGRTMSYNPQGNGINESSHRVLRSLSKNLCLQMNAYHEGREVEPLTTDEFFHQVASMYNALPHYSLGASPYFLTFGHEAQIVGLGRQSRYHHDGERQKILTEIRIALLFDYVKKIEQTWKDREVAASKNEGRALIGRWVIIKATRKDSTFPRPKKMAWGRYFEHANNKSDNVYSIPMKVLGLHNETLTVHPIGAPETVLNFQTRYAVPLLDVIPYTLAEYNWEKLKQNTFVKDLLPKEAASLRDQINSGDSGPLNYDEIQEILKKLDKDRESERKEKQELVSGTNISRGEMQYQARKGMIDYLRKAQLLDEPTERPKRSRPGPIDGKDLYMVEKIVDHGVFEVGDRRDVMYRVRWDGWSPTDDSWIRGNKLNKNGYLDNHAAFC